MSSELAARIETLPVEHGGGNLVQAIIQAAHDPNVDVTKMREMMELAKEMRAEQAKIAYAEALAQFTRLKHTIATNRKGEGPGGAVFQYADWPTMEAAIRPWLSQCGLSVTHRQDAPIVEGGKIVMIMVHAILSHVAGHSETVAYPGMPNPKVADRLSPSQAIQQGITYAKRQSVALLLGLATAEDRNDDDGQKPGPELSEKQTGTLLDLVAEWNPSKEDKARLLKWCKVDVIEDIKPRQYDIVVQTLKDKIAEKKA